LIEAVGHLISIIMSTGEGYKDFRGSRVRTITLKISEPLALEKVESLMLGQVYTTVTESDMGQGVDSIGKKVLKIGIGNSQGMRASPFAGVYPVHLCQE